MRHYSLIFHCSAHIITNNLFSVFFPDFPDTLFLLEPVHIQIHLSRPWPIHCTIKVWHGRCLVVVCCISAFSHAPRVIFSRFTLRILLVAKARLSSSWKVTILCVRMRLHQLCALRGTKISRTDTMPKKLWVNWSFLNSSCLPQTCTQDGRLDHAFLQTRYENHACSNRHCGFVRCACQEELGHGFPKSHWDDVFGQ